MPIRPGRILSIAIVLGWTVLLGVHLSRSYAREEATPLVDLSTSAEAGVELTQRGIFYRGARIGYIREQRTPLDQGYLAQQKGDLTLTLLGRERRMQMEGSARTGAKGELREFQFRLSSSSRRSPFQTTVRGQVDGDELSLTIDSGRSQRTERRRLDEPIVLPLNLYYSLASKGFTPGETYRVRLFDPMTLSDGDATVAVKETEVVRWGGHEEEAFRLQTTFSGLTTTTWVNARGEVLQEETPLGWTLRKEAPGSSLAATRGEAAPDVLLQSAIPAVGFAAEAANLELAEIRLNNFPEGFPEIVGGRQSIVGDRIRIRRESPPYRGEEELPQDVRDQALASDAFIQSDEPEIVATARGLTEGMDDVTKARTLNEWVYENVTKSPTLSLPSAKEVLEQRVGDCNEHAVLFTALARAAGVPTRISTGLAYTGGQFYYHAWPEVWVGRWLAVDPTFGQFPADPLHLRLMTGGLESQYEVLGILGRGATIDVLEWQ
jgi:hypothetical protein